MTTSQLSLCMIVKNEEDSIGKCLSSVSDYVDEMIIVDTGSRDKTVEICKSFGAKVFEFPWNGSFANARNFGLKFATSPWILWLDADEEVDPEDAYKLRNLSLLDQYDILTVRLINYFGEQVNKDEFTQLSHTRLFRNHMGIHFINDIHETLNLLPLADPRAIEGKVGALDLRVYHYGYLTNSMQKKDKRNRNIKILRKQLHRGDPWMTFHLAAECYQQHKLEKAFEFLNLAIKQFLEKKMLPPSIIYKFKYAILTDLQSWDQASAGIDRAILLYPDYVDLHFYKGHILFNRKMYVEALKAFNKCIELGDENLDYYTLKGVGSFRAWFYKGQCYEQLSRTKEAIKCYLKSIEVSAEYIPAKEALQEIAKDNKQGITVP